MLSYFFFIRLTEHACPYSSWFLSITVHFHTVEKVPSPILPSTLYLSIVDCDPVPKAGQSTGCRCKQDTTAQRANHTAQDRKERP
eukprot:m.75935 g.75935  ORF g.75935 m.75935 type:complete len:85 (+) comp9029_c0_seq1:2936-3190(+)